MRNKNQKKTGRCLFPGKTVIHQEFGKGQVTAGDAAKSASGLAVRFDIGDTRIFDAGWIRANCR